MRLLILGGSLQAGLNAALSDVVASVAPEGVEVARFEGLDRLPFYRAELDAAGVSAEVDAFRAAVAEADLVAMVSPEHNGMPTAVLKNALDLASRPRENAPLAGKPVAVLTASPTPGGGARAAAALVSGLRSARAVPLERTVSVPAAHTRLVDGAYDEGVRTEVAALVADLVDTVAAVA